MKKKILVCLSMLSLFGMNGYAQQDPLFTQYMDNQIYVNPAFAGSKEYMEITGVHRQQWVGITGAPMTTTLAIHTPLKYKSIGLGLDIMNDKVGPINRFNASVDFAYRIHFDNESKLSFGIKAGIDSYSSSFNDIDHSGVDPLAQELSGAISPTFGAGMYYFAPKWFAGASIPRLTNNLSGNVGGLDSAMHVFGIAGVLLDLNDKWQLRPTTQIRYTSGVPISAGLSVAAISNNNKLWLGLNYRLKESAGAFIQFKITDQFKLGYAYDFPLSQIRTATSGSHEILLSFGFTKNIKGLVSPRYF
jgi:type IX secretion system PorP/SprF family membrane protein